MAGRPAREGVPRVIRRCWCADCEAPRDLTQHGRCAACGSDAVEVRAIVELDRRLRDCQPALGLPGRVAAVTLN